jgi:hypothetical protein
MANLFWKSKSGIKSLPATPFKTEEEFERTIFETSELLEEIFLLKRQIRGGGNRAYLILLEWIMMAMCV